MRMKYLVPAAVLAPLIFAAPAAADYLGGGMRANDTGGIIPWSPEIRYVYRDIAADYCARWNKRARITSVRARYGDYVGFACYYSRCYDPVKMRVLGVDNCTRAYRHVKVHVRKRITLPIDK